MIDNRYLVGQRIPIDLAVLCNIMERLFGLAIMTASQRHRGNLHGVLLPQSWVVALWKDFNTFKETTLAPLWALAQSTETLLNGIYTGEYLRGTMIDPQNFSEFCYSHRNRRLVTPCRLAGPPTQGREWVQGSPTAIPTRRLYCSHVSVLFLLKVSPLTDAYTE